MNFLESSGNEPPRSPNNPNKRILRKLWLRMTEQDYRTKLKALQILHHTSMDLTSEANARYDGYSGSYSFAQAVQRTSIAATQPLSCGTACVSVVRPSCNPCYRAWRRSYRVRNQFLKMRDETNHKNRNEVYFEVRQGATADLVQMLFIVDSAVLFCACAGTRALTLNCPGP